MWPEEEVVDSVFDVTSILGVCNLVRLFEFLWVML
jgi:hypothetical protein